MFRRLQTLTFPSLASIRMHSIIHPNLFIEKGTVQLSSLHHIQPETKIDLSGKRSKYFKCSYQVFPVHHVGFMKFLLTYG